MWLRSHRAAVMSVSAVDVVGDVGDEHVPRRVRDGEGRPGLHERGRRHSTRRARGRRQAGRATGRSTLGVGSSSVNGLRIKRLVGNATVWNSRSPTFVEVAAKAPSGY